MNLFYCTAVGACAKFCGDMVIRIWRQRRFFSCKYGGKFLTFVEQLPCRTRHLIRECVTGRDIANPKLQKHFVICGPVGFIHPVICTSMKLLYMVGTVWLPHFLQGDSMMTSSNDNIPLTKASNAELWCFIWCAPEQNVKCWANNGDAGDLRRHGAHCDATVLGKANGIAGSFVLFKSTITVVSIFLLLLLSILLLSLLSLSLLLSSVVVVLLSLSLSSSLLS